MASDAHRLLVVDDEPDLLTLYELTLLREGHDVECAGSVQEALQALERQSFHLVITDMRLPDGQGLELLRHVESAGRGEKVVVITAYGSAETAVAALKAGAFDYLTKPVDLRQFRTVVAAALGQAPAAAPVPRGAAMPRAERGTAPARPEVARLVGDSPAIRQVRMLVDKVSRGMAPVLVTGESGTGKELVAKAIHQASARASGPFVPVNCGAIPESLLEAEFFGYRKGAFTGAADDRPGFFQAAQGGTLFLDEIGDLPLEAQTYLLRALQEGVIERLGSTEPIAIDVRIIAATHVDLARAVEEGRFRLDLLHRLKVLEVTVPRLRDRGDDVRVLADHFLERFRTDTRRVIRGFSAEAMDAVLMHQWPGNVREMSNRIRQACVLGEGRWISATDLGLRAAQASSNQTLDEIREQAEVRAIREALLANERGMARAAESLGVSRMTLYRLIQKHQAHLLDVIGDVGASEKAVPSKGSQVQLVA
jgi:two-component system response regulator PilR (NtrC family)